METEDRVFAIAIVIGALLFAFGCWFLERGAADTAVGAACLCCVMRLQAGVGLPDFPDAT